MGKRPRSSLKRRKGDESPRPCIVIVCEGEKTEPDYFRALKKKVGDSVQIRKPIGGLNSPNRVAKRAKEERQKERSANGLYDGDQFWAVFDRDQDAHYYDAIATCEKARIGVAHSNPCFELWLILHYQDYDHAETSKQMQRDLERISDGAYSRKKGKTMDFDLLMERLEEAEARAERQLARRKKEAGPGGKLPAPYTTVFQLTRAVKRAAGKRSKAG